MFCWKTDYRPGFWTRLPKHRNVLKNTAGFQKKMVKSSATVMAHYKFPCHLDDEKRANILLFLTHVPQHTKAMNQGKERKLSWVPEIRDSTTSFAYYHSRFAFVYIILFLFSSELLADNTLMLVLPSICYILVLEILLRLLPLCFLPLVINIFSCL